jgi:hypothetical protein
MANFTLQSGFSLVDHFRVDDVAAGRAAGVARGTGG